MFKDKIQSLQPKSPLKWVVIAFVVMALLVIMSKLFYSIPSGHRGIVLSFGKVQDIVGDGLHVKIPVLQNVVVVDIRTRKANSPANAGPKDLQIVTTDVALNYHLNEATLKDTYTRIGLNVEEKVIEPRIQEVVKSVIARFSAEELLSKRDAVKQEISLGLKNSLAAYNVSVEDIQITNFEFSQAFNEAIEAKQTAEQNALKAKNDLERIKVEAEQKITMAQAEAEAIRIQSQAIKEQGGQEYVQMKAIEKWDGTMPQVMSGGSTPFISVPINTNK